MYFWLDPSPNPTGSLLCQEWIYSLTLIIDHTHMLQYFREVENGLYKIN